MVTVRTRSPRYGPRLLVVLSHLAYTAQLVMCVSLLLRLAKSALQFKEFQVNHLDAICDHKHVQASLTMVAD